MYLFIFIDTYILKNVRELFSMLVYAMRSACARHAPMVKVNHRKDKCPFIYIYISHTTHKTPTAIYIEI